MVSDTNAATLRAYAAHAELYAARTTDRVSGAARDWIDGLLRDLPRDAAILEIGSAHGRDARYIRERGFAIQCSDAVDAFVAGLRARGFPARRFDLLADDLAGPYDLVFANAVLVHFTRPEFDRALAKVVGALRPGGRFAFSLKAGRGSGWSDAKLGAPRYFTYWSEADLAAALASHGLTDAAITAARTDRAHADWLYAVVRRPPDR